jgi:predicted AlkP superfamily phosphohydrolase/phosphomutase
MTSERSEQRSQTDRVVVIGFDMGDATLIRDWAAQGHLPNFASLIADGTWLDLRTTADILHTSTWPSFATGNKPGKHGVYYPYQPSPGYQEAQLIQPDQYGSPTFWARADRDGAKTIVYDVPETFPEPQFGGKAVFELGTWAWYGTRKSSPPELLDEIKRKFGPHPLKMEAKRLGLQFPNPRVLERRLIKSIEHKAESFLWLLGEGDWDLAVTVFGETHPAGHYLWPKSVGANPDTSSAEFEVIRRVYRAIDTAVGRIAESVPEKTTLLLVSGDGVMTNNCGWHLLPDVLTELGYSAPPSQDESGEKSGGLSLGSIKDMMPKKVRRLIADSLPWWLRDKIGASINAAQIDWSRSKAFALPTDLEGCIRINLKGREPQGVVEPGEEYERLCQNIAADVRKLVNPETGMPVVNDVWIVHEHFEGPMADHLPDITITWHNDAPISALHSDTMGTVTGESPDPRTGTHSTRGFSLAFGDSVPAGTAASGHLTDLGPTVLALLGLDSTGMDGAPLNLKDGQHRGQDQTESRGAA